MKYTQIYVVLILLIFSGCSAKEFGDGAKDVGNDISKIFEPTKKD